MSADRDVRETGSTGRAKGSGSTDAGSGWLDLAGRLLRGVLLLTGIAVFGVALLVAFVPEAEERFPVEAAVAALGSDYLIVAVVGLFTVGLAILVVVTRHVRGVQEGNPPVVEGVQSATYPGASFDQSTGGLLGLLSRDASAADRRSRLTEAAVRATMRSERCSHGVATRRVAEGTWTDDPVAARYLTDSSHTGGMAGWIRARGSGRERTVGRTLDAIAHLMGDGNGPGRGATRNDGEGGKNGTENARGGVGTETEKARDSGAERWQRNGEGQP